MLRVLTASSTGSAMGSLLLDGMVVLNTATSPDGENDWKLHLRNGTGNSGSRCDCGCGGDDGADDGDGDDDCGCGCDDDDGCCGDDDGDCGDDGDDNDDDDNDDDDNDEWRDLGLLIGTQTENSSASNSITFAKNGLLFLSRHGVSLCVPHCSMISWFRARWEMGW